MSNGPAVDLALAHRSSEGTQVERGRVVHRIEERQKSDIHHRKVTPNFMNDMFQTAIRKIQIGGLAVVYDYHAVPRLLVQSQANSILELSSSPVIHFQNVLK